ncbi:MAG: hypothetical protein AAFV87_09120 [Pseudomonadota bacterium]
MFFGRSSILSALLIIFASGAAAQDKTITLSAPPELIENGFLKYVLPRFSLKTGIRIEIVDVDAAARFGSEGRALFTDGTVAYGFSNDPSAERFADWLKSDIGMRTIEAFTIDGAAVYSKAKTRVAVVQRDALTGDEVRGEKLSFAQCGRCHVIGERNRMSGIGSTPSFALLRAFDDWENRFTAFYVLKPHGAFTVIEGVTPAFDPASPPPIAPIKMSLDDLDDVLAYVARMEPADLGAPLKHQ